MVRRTVDALTSIDVAEVMGAYASQGDAEVVGFVEKCLDFGLACSPLCWADASQFLLQVVETVEEHVTVHPDITHALAEHHKMEEVLDVACNRLAVFVETHMDSLTPETEAGMVIEKVAMVFPVYVAMCVHLHAWRRVVPVLTPLFAMPRYRGAICELRCWKTCLRTAQTINAQPQPSPCASCWRALRL